MSEGMQALMWLAVGMLIGGVVVALIFAIAKEARVLMTSRAKGKEGRR